MNREKEGEGGREGEREREREREKERDCMFIFQGLFHKKMKALCSQHSPFYKLIHLCTEHELQQALVRAYVAEAL